MSNVRITNPRRKKQIDEFMDKNRKVMMEYYDLLDTDLSESKFIQQLEALIEEDPDFYDTYTTLAEIWLSKGKTKKAQQLVYTAFVRGMMRIVDYKGRFPKSLLWGWLENRHLIRVINQQAFLSWEAGDTEAALYLFRNLLRSNPNDNIGARNAILAIRLGLSPDFEDEFAAPQPGFIDAIKQSNWFETQSKKFPDEFDWWWKIIQRQEES